MKHGLLNEREGNRQRHPELAAFVDQLREAGFDPKVLLVEETQSHRVISILGRAHAYQIEKRLAMLDELADQRMYGIKAAERGFRIIQRELDELRSLVATPERWNAVRLKEVAVPVTPPLSAMGGTPASLVTPPLSLMGETRTLSKEDF